MSFFSYPAVLLSHEEQKVISSKWSYKKSSVSISRVKLPIGVTQLHSEESNSVILHLLNFPNAEPVVFIIGQFLDNPIIGDLAEHLSISLAALLPGI